MPKNTPIRIIDSQKTRAASFLGGSATTGGTTDHGLLLGLADDDHTQYHTDARGDLRYVPLTRTVTAGAGLTGGGALSGDITLTVGAGNGITVNADDVALASTTAGAGLTYTTGVLAVGAGAGLTVNADDVALTTPGTLTVSSTNAASGSHTHAITTSTDVGSVPAAAILASTAAGALTVASLFANNHVSTSLIDTGSSNLTLAPATNIVSLPSAVAVQTDNYASQLTGWRATYAGEADFRYLFVDEMHAKSFIADLEQALAGGQIITKSVAMLASAFTAPSVQLLAKATASSTTSTLTISKPTGTAQYHLMLAAIVYSSAATMSSAPSGWTLLLTQTQGGAAMKVYYKVAGASEGSSYAWTKSTSTEWTGDIYTYTNVDTASPINASNSQGNASSTNVTAPTITTTADNAKLVFLAGFYDANVTGAAATPPASFTEQKDATGGTLTWAYAADYIQATAGATGAKTAVLASAHLSTAALVALKPATTVTTPLIVRDLPSAPGMAAFVANDVVRLRQFSRSGGSLTIADCWGVVTGYVDNGDKTQTWTFTRSASPNAGTMSPGTVIAPDAIVLDYGTTGNGYYEVNAIDGAYGLNSPYARIATWTTHPATGTALRAQFGNLRGVYGYSGTEFGVAMGSATGANVTVDATNGVRLRQGTTDTIVLATNGASYFAGVMTIDTNGEIRQGTGTLGSNYTGLRIWRDTGIGRIGGYNTDVLQWYAATDGKLYAGAGNVTLDATGLTLDIGDYQANGLFPYVDIAWKAGPAESGRIGSGELNNVDEYGMRFWAGGAGITQVGNGRFEFISRDGSGTETGTATIKDGGFAGTAEVRGGSLYSTGTLYADGAATFANEINVRQHTTMEQWSIDCANGTALTMANTFVFQFSDASVFSGLVVLNNTTDGGGGVFMCSGGQVVKIADGNNVYSTTKDTASKTNVYYDAGSSEYRMQNNTGGSRTYNIFSIRLRAST